jgi:hypothetical protein
MNWEQHPDARRSDQQHSRWMALPKLDKQQSVRRSLPQGQRANMDGHEARRHATRKITEAAITPRQLRCKYPARAPRLYANSRISAMVSSARCVCGRQFVHRFSKVCGATLSCRRGNAKGRLSVRGHEKVLTVARSGSPVVAEQKSPPLARRVVRVCEPWTVTVAMATSHRTAQGGSIEVCEGMDGHHCRGAADMCGTTS